MSSEKKIIKWKNFTYYPCSILNISINTHENNSCPRGEIGRHKGLKILWIEKLFYLIPFNLT